MDLKRASSGILGGPEIAAFRTRAPGRLVAIFGPAFFCIDSPHSINLAHARLPGLAFPTLWASWPAGRETVQIEVFAFYGGLRGPTPPLFFIRTPPGVCPVWLAFPPFQPVVGYVGARRARRRRSIGLNRVNRVALGVRGLRARSICARRRFWN